MTPFDAASRATAQVVSAADRQAQAVSRAEPHVPERDGAWWVVIMAFARAKTYYIDVLPGFDAVNKLGRELNRRQYVEQPLSTFKRIRLVWAFVTDDEQEARTRAALLLATPHAWRRQQVQAVNPEWVDIGEIFVGFPLRTGHVEE